MDGQPKEVEVIGYLPVFALPYWSRIGAFVTTTVESCVVATERDEPSLYAAITPFALWCWQTRGFELEVARVFRAAVIEDFIHRGANQYSRSSRATLRSTLWRALEALAPDEARRARRPMGRSAPTAPYSPAEVAQLYGWALAQPTAHRRDDAAALLALGFGAGLATRELLRVEATDCNVTVVDGLEVRVRGSRSRVVPIADAWISTLSRVIERRPTGLLFRPSRLSAAEGQVTDFISRSRTRLDVKPARMRTTWLVHLLARGADPATLHRVSGLASLAALDRITSFVPSSGDIYDQIWTRNRPS